MKVLIKSARIADRNSTWNGKKADVLIDKGKISKIGKIDNRSAHNIDAKGMWLSPGWVDTYARFNDPGFEHKEDIYSGREAALKGGFTTVLVLPDTKPVIQTKNDVKYIISRNGGHPVEVLPLAALTVGREGHTLTEMIDLKEHGAIAFCDAGTVDNGDTLVKALRYLQKFNGLLVQTPEDTALAHGGQMHEGEVSTYLGMRGIPTVAEEIVIHRDIELLKYCGGRIHFANVSTPGGLELIRKAKKSGLNVSCSVASYQTGFTDADIGDFDTNLKLSPPVRTEKDNRKILKGLQDGTIDVINSNHTPQDTESKKLEFDLSDAGMISVQTVAHDLARMSSEVPVETLLDKVSVSPREIFGLEPACIDTKQTAVLTLFDPKAKWKFDEVSNASRSSNSAYLGHELTGKVKAVFNGEYHWIDDGN